MPPFRASLKWSLEELQFLLPNFFLIFYFHLPFYAETYVSNLYGLDKK